MELTKAKNKVNVNKVQIQMPHTLVIIAVIIALVSIATYIIPGGAYETVVVNGTFKYIESAAEYI